MDFLNNKDIIEIINKIKNNDNLTNNDLGVLAYIYINNKKLNDYVNNINLGNRVQYDINDETLYLSISGCESLEIAKQNNINIGYNQLLLFSVFHELRHIEQVKILNENPEIEDSRKIKALLYNEKNRMFGIFTNKMILEYDANIYALETLTYIFKEFNINFDKGFLNQQVKKLVRAYEDNKSVIENNLDNMNNELWLEFINNYETNIKHDFSNFTRAYNYSNKNIISRYNDLRSRLLRGDKLTKLELETLIKITNNEIVTNDIFKTLEDLNERVKLQYEKPQIEIGNINKLFR